MNWVFRKICFLLWNKNTSLEWTLIQWALNTKSILLGVTESCNFSPPVSQELPETGQWMNRLDYWKWHLFEGEKTLLWTVNQGGQNCPHNQSICMCPTLTGTLVTYAYSVPQLGHRPPTKVLQASMSKISSLVGSWSALICWWLPQFAVPWSGSWLSHVFLNPGVSIPGSCFGKSGHCGSAGY